jgi:hypothetical protein
VNQSALDGVQDIVQVLAEVFGKESEDEITVFLECDVLPTVTPVSFGVGQMLRSVQFDYQAQFFAKQIHFHAALCIERDW